MPSSSWDDGPDAGIWSDVGISAVGIGDADGIASDGMASAIAAGLIVSLLPVCIASEFAGGGMASDDCIWLAAACRSFGWGGLGRISGVIVSIFGYMGFFEDCIGVMNICGWLVVGITVGINGGIGGAAKFEYGVLSAGPAGGGE